MTPMCDVYHTYTRVGGPKLAEWAAKWLDGNTRR